MEVFKCCATHLYGFAEYAFNFTGQYRVALFAQPPGLSGWSDSGTKQTFIGVDVPDANNDVAVHDELFNRDFTSFACLVEVVAVELTA